MEVASVLLDELARLKALADTIPSPDEEWEGSLTGSTGSCRRFSARLRFKIQFAGDVIIGKGRGLDFPYGPENKIFDLEGTIDPQTALIYLHSYASFLQRTPFICLGEVSTERDKIAGGFDLACFSQNCTCGGGAGTFQFRKIGCARSDDNV